MRYKKTNISWYSSSGRRTRMRPREEWSGTVSFRASPGISRKDRKSRAAPADAAHSVDALETAGQKLVERAARRDEPAAGFFGVKGSTQLFEEPVKFFLIQELLQPLVKALPLTLGQLIVQKPHALLLFLPPAKAHGHIPLDKV